MMAGVVHIEAEATSPARQQWRRFRRNRAAVASGCFLGFVVLACAAALPGAARRYAETDLARARSEPSAAEPMGTDMLGRSLLWRCVLGGVVSLGVGLSAAAFSMVIGVGWGSIAGMAGGRIDALMMRVVDVLFGLPYLLVVILLKLGMDGLLRERLGVRHEVSEVIVLLLAIGGVSWLTLARIVRGHVLSLKAQPFVEAARAIGLSPAVIWRSHLLPNLAGPIVVYTTLAVPQAILQESFLSFLGIGIQPPLPSWGNLAAEGVSAVNTVERFWWMLAFPCGLLTATLLALHFLGEGLRDALNPRGETA